MDGHLPHKTVQALIKSVLPSTASVDSDAAEMIHDAAVEFVQYMTSEAEAQRQLQSHRSMLGEDVLTAFSYLGLHPYHTYLQAVQSKYQASVLIRRKRKEEQQRAAARARAAEQGANSELQQTSSASFGTHVTVNNQPLHKTVSSSASMGSTQPTPLPPSSWVATQPFSPQLNSGAATYIASQTVMTSHISPHYSMVHHSPHNRSGVPINTGRMSSMVTWPATGHGGVPAPVIHGPAPHMTQGFPRLAQGAIILPRNPSTAGSGTSSRAPAVPSAAGAVPSAAGAVAVQDLPHAGPGPVAGQGSSGSGQATTGQAGMGAAGPVAGQRSAAEIAEAQLLLSIAPPS